MGIRIWDFGFESATQGSTARVSGWPTPSPDEARPGDGNAFYTLEFSTNRLMGAPGRLRFYATPEAAPVNVLSTLITPTSMTRDDDTGNALPDSAFAKDIASARFALEKLMKIAGLGISGGSSDRSATVTCARSTSRSLRSFIASDHRRCSSSKNFTELPAE